MPIYKTDRRKDGKQQYRVRINYTDKDGNHRQIERTAYGYDAARQLEQDLMNSVAPVSDSNISVQELLSRYDSARAAEVREITRAKTKKVFHNHIEESFGNTPLSELSVNALQKWKNEINQKGLLIETRRGIYKEFHGMLAFAVKMQYIDRNPLDAVGNFRDVNYEHAAEKLQYYTPEQFQKYMASALKIAGEKPLAWNMYVFFAVAYYTGMRKGEINALRWSDVGEDEIAVRRSVCQKVKGEAGVVTSPKTKASYRSLKIPRILQDILAEQKARQQEEGWSEELYVCGGRCCLRDTTIELYNQRFAADAGLPHIRIHDFRHSHASLLVNEGINIQEVARRLGHSNVQITWNRYSHLYPRESERAISVLEKVSIPEKSTKKTEI